MGTPRQLTLEVAGVPIAKGSWRIIPNRKTGKGMLVQDAKQGRAWAEEVTLKCRTAWAADPMTGPVEIDLTFLMPRPKSVTREMPTVKPDIDKLARNVLDAIVKAGVVEDDCQVVELTACKWYGDAGFPCGVWIRVEPAESPNTPVEWGT